MATPTVPAFVKTLEKSELWLDEIVELMDWSDRRLAYRALRFVLHELRDRMTSEEVTDMAAQMPMLIRGLFLDGWSPNHKPNHGKTVMEFVEAVNHNFSEDSFVGSEDITRAVLNVIQRHITQGEIDDVVYSLPVALQELWD